MVKWAIELGEFDLHFKPRTTIKGQAAADFITEFIPLDSGNPDPDALAQDAIWELHVDGSLNNRAGIKITDPEKNSDSQLVVNQVAGDLKANQNNLGSYKSLAGALLQHFTSYKPTQIPWAKNYKADALMKLATAPPESMPPDVHIEILDKPSVSA
ncbi:hypothetical protein ACLB2K_066120 [Fragaria x ananassa]